MLDELIFSAKNTELVILSYDNGIHTSIGIWDELDVGLCLYTERQDVLRDVLLDDV